MQECGDPHAANMYMLPCRRCEASGKISSLSPHHPLLEAVTIADPSAVEWALQEQRSQSELDEALRKAVRLTCARWGQKLNCSEHVGLLLEAGSDVQAGFHQCVCREALDSGYRGRTLSNPTQETISMMRLLVASGASTGEKEMQSLQKAFELIDRYEDQRDFKDVVESIAGILRSAQQKILNVNIEDVCSDPWTVKVHSLDGECVAIITDVSCSITFGELQKEIGLQASIPHGQQCLLVGDRKIETQSARSMSLHEIFTFSAGETQE